MVKFYLIYIREKMFVLLKFVNIHVFYYLIENFQIKEGLKTFGVNESSESLPIIVLVVNQLSDNSTNTNLFDQIKGKLLPIESLKTLRNESLIDKVLLIAHST